MPSNSQTTGPICLALDTSLDVCSLALSQEDRLLGEFRFRHEMHLSERLINYFDRLLQDFDLTIDSIDLLAVGLGPGSFTGARIGVMTMMTIAWSAAKPIYGIIGPEAIAAAYSGLTGIHVVPMLPCRRESVYVGIYDGGSNVPQAIVPPEALTIPELSEKLLTTGGSFLLCGPEAEKRLVELQALPNMAGCCLSLGSQLYPSASDLIKLALERRKSGDSGDEPFELKPFYISPPPITMPKGKSIPTGGC